MTTLGIDLSSQPKATAACVINWSEGQAIAAAPSLGCTDVVLHELIATADAIGIDAPFGWPDAFVKAVGEWSSDAWTTDSRDRLRFRETDRFVRETQGIWPLSVSTDTIALPAMRAMSILRKHGVADRSGDGRFFEVYPAASLRAWRMPSRGYKEVRKPECIAVRKAILAAISSALPWFSAPAGYADTSDALDSLVASLSVRTAAQGLSVRPTREQSDAASREGWIHIPKDLPRA